MSDDADIDSIEVPLDKLDITLSTSDGPRPSGSGTAARAARLMAERPGFVQATSREKRCLSEAFASVDKPVYGQAFDLVGVSGEPIDLTDLAVVKARLADLTLYEIKATNKNRPDDFTGHFFSLSTAELLVAQKLGGQFKFLFVNVRNEHFVELSLAEIFAKAKAIYPGWSIMF